MIFNNAKYSNKRNIITLLIVCVNMMRRDIFNYGLQRDTLYISNIFMHWLSVSEDGE